MDSFGVGQLTGTQRDELMEQVKQQLAVANAQELLTKMTGECFRKCVQHPGKPFDGYEQNCVANCMDRFLDSWNLVSKVYSNRLQRESQNM